MNKPLNSTLDGCLQQFANATDTIAYKFNYIWYMYGRAVHILSGSKFSKLSLPTLIVQSNNLLAHGYEE